jgi:hypothetical protein
MSGDERDRYANGKPTPLDEEAAAKSVDEAGHAIADSARSQAEVASVLAHAEATLISLALPIDRPDPNVKLPKAVKDSIARGEAAFEKKRSKSRRSRKGTTVAERKASGGRRTAKFTTSTVSLDVQERRQAHFDHMAQTHKGAVGQPPMLERQQDVLIVVDRLMADGVPFDIEQHSKSEMVRLVQEWLNAHAKTRAKTHAEGACGIRKSRRKQLSFKAVSDLLKKIKHLI